ncbi:Rho guanyl nucleotide exchange factor [Fusarium globosum]|uniref:Rho guanyl nucleotide exchange factor n=1 Tax=Fusarium globosum TaxID=78864 RepID=A0A8H5Y912_9HYPO|nr:Rho guanyl nucleotide exchange factor [Fusarium globosum]
MLSTVSNSISGPTGVQQVTWAPRHKLDPVLEHDSQHAECISTINLPKTLVFEEERHSKNRPTTKVTTDAQLHDMCTSLITQRRNVIKELIDTERIFTRDMRILLHVYKETADACPALDFEAIQLIFRNIDDIVSVHTSFQSELEKSAASVYNHRHEKPPVGNKNIPTTNFNQNILIQVSEAEDIGAWIGRAFMLNIDSISMVVKKFLQKDKEVREYLVVIQKHPAVVYWMEQCREVTEHLTHAWDLGSLLIKPLQRITRYPILITSLLQHTPHDYPDRKDLLEARERFNALLFQVNTITKLFEATPRPITKTYTGSIAKPGMRRTLRKSMSKMRLWSHRLNGNQSRVDDRRVCSAPLDDGTDERGPCGAHEMSLTNPFSRAKGDHGFPHTWYSSRSAPDLLTKTSK